MILLFNNSIRPAVLGFEELLAIVLVLIVCILSNFVCDYLRNIKSNDEGVTAMRAKMKKIFATLAILGAMTFGLTSNVLAQDDEFFQEESEQVVEEAAEEAAE